MSLKETIQNDVKTAMKAQESAKVSTLRMLVSEIKKREIDKRSPLEEAEILKTIATMVKQRGDSIEAFNKGNRPDLAQKEQVEIDILKTYMPAQLSHAEVETIVKAVIAETGANSPNDIGKVMKAALAKAGSKADGKVVNEIARTLLAPK